MTDLEIYMTAMHNVVDQMRGARGYIPPFANLNHSLASEAMALIAINIETLDGDPELVAWARRHSSACAELACRAIAQEREMRR